MMNDKAQKSGVVFRPHFKTHQSLEVGRWFRKAGIERITVSSVRMANYFARDGWDDITIAFPLNIRELDAINSIAGKINLNILVENEDVIPHMINTLDHPIGIFLKIDTGYHRTGISANGVRVIQGIINKLEKNPLFQLRGLLTHTGHTYKTSSTGEIMAHYKETVDALVELKKSISSRQERVILSIGDTPSCSLVDRFDGIDEIRPGNFIFYDFMQYQLGSCTREQIAVMLAAPIVAKHAERNEIVVYSGAIHLSKESISLPDGKLSFGSIVQISKDGWGNFEEDCYVSGLSQEHGIIQASNTLMNRLEIGDLIGIIPVHSCLTANLMKGYVTLEDEKVDHFEGRMRDDG
jgi:D-serine deaminase-like pyridoxal phosphate-dependent protein